VAKTPTLGVLIQEARDRLGLSQAEVADRCGLAPSHVSRLESDEKVDVRFKTIARIAAVLGLSLDDLSASLGYGGTISAHDPHSIAIGERVLIAEKLAVLKKTLAAAQSDISSTISGLRTPNRPRSSEASKRR
jgi:transcriptional regulator with XRE-family HTH domain